jgi:hypothetical protein
MRFNNVWAIATTAGAGRDATLVQRLRAAGAVIVGKTNLSEWANISLECLHLRLECGGRPDSQPFARDCNPCGSSSGSGAAGSRGHGFRVYRKPTVGLVSRHTHCANQPQPGHRWPDD